MAQTSRPKAAKTRPRKVRPNSLMVRLTRSSRHSWERWKIRRLTQKMHKAEAWLILLQVETDSQLLRVKEARQELTALHHRQLEQADSQTWHRQNLDSLATLPSLMPTGAPQSKVLRLDSEKS